MTDLMTPEELDVYENKQIALEQCVHRIWEDAQEIDRLNRHEDIRIPAMEKVHLPTIVEKLQEIIERNPL